MEISELEPSHLGKTDKLPSDIVVSKFSAARGKEIQTLKHALQQSSGTKLAFQKLPIHMIRRAMSHNVKRLPRRLREIHKNQTLKQGVAQKSKKPSRKYRRRPHNLVSDYERRQRRVTWLNTHLWHAKRFHMIEKWGYKIPNYPCDKSFRACYRASAKHCLLQDISYFKCIEIQGSYSFIVNKFKNITYPNTGLTIAARIYKKGNREGRIVICNNLKAIGEVYFQWKPSINGHSNSLWIWVHAAYYSEILQTLIHHFNVQNNGDDGKIYTSTEVTIKELCDELGRFRLIGPFSNIVMHNSLKTVAKNNTETVNWLQNYSDDITCQAKFWNDLKNVSSTAELPPSMILSLVVNDPRFNFPKKRTKSLFLADEENSSFENILPDNISESALWEKDLRNAVRLSKISNFQITQLRQKLLVPGTDLEEKPVPVPIILVQNPGIRDRQYLGFGAGWDIILPLEWAQPFWLSLIMWGARAGGLREHNHITLEMGQSNRFVPDSKSGNEEETQISNKSKEDFFKKPPNKRCNFNKFNISSPFDFNWDMLLNEWCDRKDEFIVLRNKITLRNIQEVLSKNTKVDAKSINFYEKYLVPVRIKPVKRSVCSTYSIICLPNDGDHNKEPEEPVTVDSYQKERKILRDQHKSLLKRLRKRRIRAKRDNKKFEEADKEMLLNYQRKMRELWLPKPKIIRKSCARDVMGFLKDGGFSYLAAKSSGVGYVTLPSIKCLLDLRIKNKVLIRSTDSRQYRLANIEIICE